MADNLQSIEKLMDSYDSNRSRLAETQKLVEKWEPTGPVSYTHLTLPTILLV